MMSTSPRSEMMMDISIYAVLPCYFGASISSNGFCDIETDGVDKNLMVV